jgi:beta-galactosidase
MTFQALRWFARGGTHLNYYMFWGGYNRGRSAAAGIMNAYASDACICPSGQRRQPKYDHFSALHESLALIAPILLSSDTALFKEETAKIKREDGEWVDGPDQIMFRYHNTNADLGMTEVVFVENTASLSRIVKVPKRESEDAHIVEMQAYSAILLVDNRLIFDSSGIKPRFQSFRRLIVDNAAALLDLASWKEPLGASDSDPRTHISRGPLEQTALMLNSTILSDYAWYETDFFLDVDVNSLTLFVDTQKANAFLAFVDGKRVGWADDHEHAEGSLTLNMTLGRLSRGSHTLSLLSESLGYSNLIGRWGASTKAKPKGLTGDVLLYSPNLGRNVSLVDGRSWRSRAGLHGESLMLDNGWKPEYLAEHLEVGRYPCSWTSISFDTPRYDRMMQGLFVDISTGRGHLWLNGRDLGRYWNITRGGTDQLSQRYYFLPNDYLYKSGKLNKLVFFDAFGGDQSEASLVLSWIEATNQPNFQDEVDYPLACI